MENERKKCAYNIKIQADSLVKFFDDNGFTGLFRDGEWFYQKFHTKKEIEDIALRISCNAQIYYNAQAFEICAIKTKEIERHMALSGLMFEWDLPLPKGERYNLQFVIKDAYEQCTNN